MLSKNRTFLDGVKELRMFIQQSGGKFDYRSYFLKMNFEVSFIEKVALELQQLKTQGSGSKTLNPDIQGKLDRIKMKLEGINAESSAHKMDKGNDRGVYTSAYGEERTPKGRDLISNMNKDSYRDTNRLNRETNRDSNRDSYR